MKLLVESVSLNLMMFVFIFIFFVRRTFLPPRYPEMFLELFFTCSSPPFYLYFVFNLSSFPHLSSFFFPPLSSFLLFPLFLVSSFPSFLSSTFPLFHVFSLPLLYNFSSLFYIEGFYLKASRGLKASSICTIDLSFSGLPTMDTTSKRSQSSILFFFT